MTHDEDLLEQLFWEFDEQRKRSGDERMAFKGKMRFYAKRIAGTERQACTKAVEDMAERYAMGSIEERLLERATEKLRARNQQ